VSAVRWQEISHGNNQFVAVGSSKPNLATLHLGRRSASHMSENYYLTSKENIALNLVFEWLGESRYNRTSAEYLDLASKLPKIDAAYQYVNARLNQIAKEGTAPFRICYFKKGDTGSWFAPYPTSLSKETVRKAIHKFKEQARILRDMLAR
jgi:hypothetical protein